MRCAPCFDSGAPALAIYVLVVLANGDLPEAVRDARIGWYHAQRDVAVPESRRRYRGKLDVYRTANVRVSAIYMAARAVVLGEPLPDDLYVPEYTDERFIEALQLVQGTPEDARRAFDLAMVSYATWIMSKAAAGADIVPSWNVFPLEYLALRWVRRARGLPEVAYEHMLIEPWVAAIMERSRWPESHPLIDLAVMRHHRVVGHRIQLDDGPFVTDDGAVRPLGEGPWGATTDPQVLALYREAARRRRARNRVPAWTAERRTAAMALAHEVAVRMPRLLSAPIDWRPEALRAHCWSSVDETARFRLPESPWSDRLDTGAAVTVAAAIADMSVQLYPTKDVHPVHAARDLDDAGHRYMTPLLVLLANQDLPRQVRDAPLLWCERLHTHVLPASRADASGRRLSFDVARVRLAATYLAARAAALGEPAPAALYAPEYHDQRFPEALRLVQGTDEEALHAFDLAMVSYASWLVRHDIDPVEQLPEDNVYPLEYLALRWVRRARGLPELPYEHALIEPWAAELMRTSRWPSSDPFFDLLERRHLEEHGVPLFLYKEMPVSPDTPEPTRAERRRGFFRWR